MERSEGKGLTLEEAKYEQLECPADHNNRQKEASHLSWSSSGMSSLLVKTSASKDLLL